MTQTLSLRLRRKRSYFVTVLAGSFLSFPSDAFSQTSPTTGRCNQHERIRASGNVSSRCCAVNEYLGVIRRIQVPGENDFLSVMSIPTFAAQQDPSSAVSDASVSPLKDVVCRGLEGVLGQGPAFVLDNAMDPLVCQQIIETTEQLGFVRGSAKNQHGALQIVVSQKTADDLAQRISRHVDVNQVEELCKQMQDGRETVDQVRFGFAGLNRRWRIYKYEPDGKETFLPHIDASFPPSGVSKDGTELVYDVTEGVEGSGKIESRLTILIYLNDEFVGGETNFYQPHSWANGNAEPKLIASIRPKQGSVLVFPQGVGDIGVDYARQHWPLHEGSVVRSGSPKYVIRSDILFTQVKEPISDDRHFQYDHLVRKVFLPKSPIFDKSFLGHVCSVYEPCMGAENLGPLLYSFLRFTKKRRIVEIGAGYTTPWILQALKDNDDEMKRIRGLGDRCRLLDYPWVAPNVVDGFDDESAALICFDNFQHQKEAATGAMAVVKSLNLNDYVDFRITDAYAMSLDESSVDVLWCDFGVGSKMKDFVKGSWASIRPGGYLLCHSTLTNEGTRTWLEACRDRREEDETGIPQGEFTEVSFLEPHKHYQNAITILQKRRSYDEPIYSLYA
jgi:hypothetical protein